MKTPKTASQIKRFLRLFGIHARGKHPPFFFRQALSD